MIEHFVKVSNYKQAYALIMEFRQEIPNVNLAYYVNTDVLLAIGKSNFYTKVNPKSAAKPLPTRYFFTTIKSFEMQYCMQFYLIGH